MQIRAPHADSSSSRRSQPLPPDWPHLRAAILQRDGHHCRHQGPRCIGHATEVDHIVPASEDGSDHPTNLQAICHPCHLDKSAAEGGRATSRKNAKRLRPTAQHPGLK